MIMAAYYLVVGGGAWLVYQELLGWGAAQLDHGYSGPEESVPTESGQLVHGMTIYRTRPYRYRTSCSQIYTVLVGIEPISSEDMKPKFYLKN